MEPKPGLSGNLVISPGLSDVSVRRAFYQKLFPQTSLEDSSQPIVFEVNFN